jgi:outer membrane protein TolC
MKIKNLNYLISIEQLDEARLQLVPQIYGRYDVQRNLIIPSTLVPLGIFNPELPPDELTPIKFGTNWSSVIGLFGSVKIFDPQIIGDIREKKASISLSDVERKITEMDLENLTGQAYANCLLSEEQLKFATDDTVNSYRFLNESYLKYKAGMLKQTELNQAILSHSNSLSRFNEAVRILSDSRKTLFYWMGMTENETENVVLTDSLDVLIERLSISEDETMDITKSLTYIRYNALNNLDNIRLKNVKTEFLPVISLNGVLANDYYANNLNPGNNDYWFGNSNINLSLRIPITEGINRTKRIIQQKYKTEATLEELNAAVSKKQLELNRVSDNITFYKKEIVRQTSNLELAKSNLNISFSLFSEDRILLSELTEAEISYKQTKIDFLKVMYNYINSLLELKLIRES